MLYCVAELLGKLNCLLRSLGNVSVVQMARAVDSQCWCVLPRPDRALEIFDRIFWRGSRCPITPVLMTTTEDSVDGLGADIAFTPEREAGMALGSCEEVFNAGVSSVPSDVAACDPQRFLCASRLIDQASSIPPFPVTAFAQPELTTTPLIPLPSFILKISLLTVTGAAWNLFLVNTAAEEHGVSEAIKARSSNRVFEGLTPTCVAEARKPFG